eukprot:gnl/TRDRNA2_/TRDRNA2_166591_c0_seq1.p1 gnl/TRDRNA2_/TRDRNA2_166591_c0~~gnl/TRDRNA2_/TRDRNA2_166591_c0_seq1.p1  ORF type:complete len:343 (+),score=66.35 gnl/TRDRNA2_/TRDRNA2_166591_c0_seq1:131-1159(+)
MMRRNVLDVKSHLVQLPPGTLNSESHDPLARAPGLQPIVHLAGVVLGAKTSFFRHVHEELCAGRIPSPTDSKALRTVFIHALQRELHSEVAPVAGHARVAMSQAAVKQLRALGRLEEAAAMQDLTQGAVKGLTPGEATAEIHERAHLALVDNRLPEAEAGFRRAVSAFRRLLAGDDSAALYTYGDHGLATALDNLGHTLQLQQKPADSVPFHVEALQLRKENFGNSHHDTLASVFSLATAFGVMGRKGEAEWLHRRAVRGAAKLGDARLSVKFLDALAILLANQRRLQESSDLFNKALRSAMQYYGADNADVQTLRERLALVDTTLKQERQTRAASSTSLGA